MPELPEVETIKRGLQDKIVGLEITDVKVLSEKNFQGDKRDIIGGVIKSVDRRAKILIINIDTRSPASGSGNSTRLIPFDFAQGRQSCYKPDPLAGRQIPETSYLLIHLKMTGQIVISNIPARRRAGKYQKLIRQLADKNNKNKSKKSPYNIDSLPNKYTRVVISFDNGSKLYFNDLRKFGWMKIISNIKNQKLKNLNIDQIIGEKYGPEPFDKKFNISYLKNILSKWGRPVKLLLMDQKKIAGIGNIYANEALFCAGIAPHHRGKELTNDHPEKVEKLYHCIKNILLQAIKLGGSTASDDAYRNVKGERGRMQEKLKVYGRVGKKCFQCGKTIKRMTLGGRGTFFCPVCQR